MGTIAWIFGWVLKLWFNILGNYGWAVILFSITMKVILLPLIKKQQESAKKGQELQPKLQALQEKYKDDQEKMSIEYQKFMQENKYNPFGGCLLMIFQMVMLIGVLYVVTYPMKYMEHQTESQIDEKLKLLLIEEDYSGDKQEFEKYAKSYITEHSGDKSYKKVMKGYSGDDISSYIKYYKVANRYHEIRLLKNEYDLNFLGINLGDITLNNSKDYKLWIFPILTTIFYYLSLWMVSKNQKTAPKMKDENGNEIEMPNMLTMNITMPLLSGWISASVPQSMGLYWFMNSFLQIIIQLFTNKEKDDTKKNESVIIEAENLEKEEITEEVKEEAKETKKQNGKNKNSSKKKKNKKK